MRTDEYAMFEGEMQQLCSALGRRCSENLVRGYWRALADVPFAEVEAEIDRAIQHAGRNTGFPTPLMLRGATPPKAPTQIADPAWRQMEIRAIEGLEDLRRRDLNEWFTRVGRDSRAAGYVRQHGSENVFFDPAEMCWRKVPKTRAKEPALG